MKRSLLAFLVLTGPVEPIRADYYLVRFPLTPSQPFEILGGDMETETGKRGDRVWFQTLLELTNPPRFFPEKDFMDIDHQWGNTTRMPLAKISLFPGMIPVKWKTPKNGFEILKEREKGGNRHAVLANWALGHGLLKEFHAVMADWKKIDPNRKAVVLYQKVEKALKNSPMMEDPAQASLLAELKKQYPNPTLSPQRRFLLFTSNPENQTPNDNRLTRLDEAYETFFYWLSLQENVDPLPLPPQHRLAVLLLEDQKSLSAKQAYWGVGPPYLSGFTPHRDNLMVLGPRADSYFMKLVACNRVLWSNLSIRKQDLTRGQDFWLGRMDLVEKYGLSKLALIQTLGVLQTALEEEGNLRTFRHEVARQLLVDTGVLPRRVVLPEWVQFGLGSLFEISYGAYLAGPGRPHGQHLIDFKYFRRQGRLENSKEVLHKVITDRFFQTALKASTDSPHKTKENWELARCTAWALVYYLARNKKLPELIAYGKELDKLPRDLDLDESMLEGCFARAFQMNGKNKQILTPAAMQKFADAWFDDMNISMENADLDRELLRFRTEISNPE